MRKYFHDWKLYPVFYFRNFFEDHHIILLHGVSIWYYSMPAKFLNPKYNECKRFFFVCNKIFDKNLIFLEIKKMLQHWKIFHLQSLFTLINIKFGIANERGLRSSKLEFHVRRTWNISVWTSFKLAPPQERIDIKPREYLRAH